MYYYETYQTDKFYQYYCTYMGTIVPMSRIIIQSGGVYEQA